ncbi:MAG: maleylpyruvate isomerase N-terminal domain-containing protein [Acidimicrobiales bacterium]
MRRLEALVNALDLQVGVGGQIQSSQLSLASACPGWTVRDVMGHSIGVTLSSASSRPARHGLRTRPLVTLLDGTIGRR